MYTLHTHEVLVLSALPQGESSMTYRLLSRERGLLIAHAQSVRELKSKGRAALQPGRAVEANLVRGRELYRLGGVRELSMPELPLSARRVVRRVYHLADRLLPVEVPHPRLYEHCTMLPDALTTAHTEEQRALESLAVFALLHELGYVKTQEHAHAREPFSEAALAWAQENRAALVRSINSALTATGV